MTEENKLVIEKALFMEVGYDSAYQTHFIEFDLYDDVIENTSKWKKFFEKYHNHRLRLTIEAIEK